MAVRRNTIGAFMMGMSLLVGASRTASASLGTYAPTIRDYLDLAAEPACTVCHEGDDGGDGTVTTPFGETIMALGAVGNEDVGSLRFALAEVDYYQVDSDADGAGDLDELRQGSDPNDPLDPPPQPPPTRGEGGEEGDQGGEGSDGTSLDETSGAGGTRSDRPPALDRRSDVTEMKTGCSAAAVHPANVGGMLLLWVGVVVAVGRRDGGRVRLPLARERSRKV